MTEEIKLNLPEPLKVDKNIAKQLDELEKSGQSIYSFAGEENIETLFELFLLKKYKSNCLVISKNNKQRLTGLSINVKLKYTKEEESKMFEEFHFISDQIIKCVKNGVKTIIIPLSYSKGRGGHANILIYRNNLSQLEHFEPHGGAFMGNEKLQSSISNVIKMFTHILNLNLKKNYLREIRYIEASEVCPYIQGLQSLESRSGLKKLKIEPIGYCAAWSMFFSELCLKNQEIPSSEIMNNIFNYLTTKPKAGDYLKSVIRGYSGNIVLTVNKYLEIFYKPKITVTDLLRFHKEYKFDKKTILRESLSVLLMLESTVFIQPNFNLEKELKDAKKQYKEKSKGMTEDEARKARRFDKLLAALYYKKRILQNYEEYNNNGKITEPIFESPLEIREHEIVNRQVIKKGTPEEVNEEGFDNVKEDIKRVSPKSVKAKKTSPNAKTKRKTPTVVQKDIKKKLGKKNVDMIQQIVIDNKIDMKTQEGREKLLKIITEMGKR